MTVGNRVVIMTMYLWVCVGDHCGYGWMVVFLEFLTCCKPWLVMWLWDFGSRSYFKNG